ncbi:MAG TPA: pentapeptide repeat-containing protein [Candidatus Acidoferrum sp.]|jgi:uncharacterized protein YjbI with pentapeptide repeats
MPEMPAEQTPGRKGNTGGVFEKGTPERLATPAELAEFGGIAPNPEVEARILELLEAQMKEDMALVEPSDLADAVATPIPEIVNEPAEEPAAEIPEVGPQALAMEAAPESIEAAEELPIPQYISKPAVQSAVILTPRPVLPAVEPHAELPSSDRVDLLEFAEALDQHRLWVETAGAQGTRGDFSGANLGDADLTGVNLQGASLQKTILRGADLSMANLRGANLAEADLRESNLLGAEFSGANLMGANLYLAEGLWAGRLGGTNLFDATLPEGVAAQDGGKTITQSTQAARWFYLLVLSLCAATCCLVALTSDVRLLLDKAALPIDRVPNFLPLQGFYLGAPLLLTVLYLRLQFLLLRLWGSMGALPAVFPDGQTPEKDGSWYLMGPIRPNLRWSRDPRSPLALLESFIAKLLVYWAVPGTIFLIWLRYLVMQDYRGTLLQVFLFTLAAGAACGLPRVVARVLRPGDWTDESTASFVKDVLSTLRAPVAAGFVLFVLSLGVIHGLPSDPTIRPDVSRGDPRRWAATAFRVVGFRPFADITEESIASLPTKDDPKDSNAGDGTGPRLNEMTLRFARGYRANFQNARMWRSNLEGASLSEADFRGVNLREGILRSAKLDRLRAAKANLVSVDAQWANFSGGDFRNADLSFANMEGATLTTANLSHASLYSVNLRHANLLRADLSHADFRDVKLEQAILSLAVLEETDMSAAKLMGANLTGAQIKGTIFLEADLSRADLRGATMTGAILRQAKLDGARLDGADLRGALGLEAWQVCSAQSWHGAQLDPDVKQAVEQSCGVVQGSTPPQPTPRK